MNLFTGKPIESIGIVKAYVVYACMGVEGGGGAHAYHSMRFIEDYPN